MSGLKEHGKGEERGVESVKKGDMGQVKKIDGVDEKKNFISQKDVGFLYLCRKVEEDYIAINQIRKYITNE